MDFITPISAILGALVGAFAGFFATAHHNGRSRLANEEFARKNRSVELNLEMHKEFVGLMNARIAVWKAYKDKQITADDPHYADFWSVANYYIRLGYLIDSELIDPKHAGKLHGQNAWWWHLHFFSNDRIKLLNEQSEIAEVARTWGLLEHAADPKDLASWEPTAKSYD